MERLAGSSISVYRDADPADVRLLDEIIWILGSN